MPALQSKADALEAIGNQTEADSVQKKLRDIQRWGSLKEKLRKYTLQTTIVALLLGCICILISFLAGSSWTMRAGIAAILLAVCGAVLWLNLRLTWLPFILAFGITALITILWYLWWDERNAKRAERNAERAERKKQIQLNIEVERITNVIQNKIGKNKPLENILPNLRSKDYEALAKTISTIDFIKDTDKGSLFKNMTPDFIFHVLVYFTQTEQVTLLRQIEQKKREDILMRYPLSQRARLQCGLQKPEIFFKESNDYEGELNAEKSRDKMYLFDNKKKVDILLKLGIDQERAERLVSEIEKTPQEDLEKKTASMIAAREDPCSDDLVTAYLILKHYERASQNDASASQDHTEGE